MPRILLPCPVAGCNAKFTEGNHEHLHTKHLKSKLITTIFRLQRELEEAKEFKPLERG